jgi:hypothetical protein
MGKARQGRARQGAARQGKAGRGMARGRMAKLDDDGNSDDGRAHERVGESLNQALARNARASMLRPRGREWFRASRATSEEASSE